MFRVARFEKILESEPTLKDVCADCNNGILSLLDAYACSLFERQFSKILERYETVNFDIDYHLLKRWLLKMSYNSARINGALDTFVFDPVLPYIMGLNNALGKTVQLYLQLTYPGPIPESFRKGEPDIPKIFSPTLNRVGHATIMRPDGDRRTLRAVHLYSYSFFLAFFHPQEGARSKQDLPAVIADTFNGATLLRANQHNVRMICDGCDAWQSFSPSLQMRMRNKHDGPGGG